MNNNPIGVFDSGVGGISTLNELTKQFPNERFIFYGDTKNAPYGSKTPDEVFQCTQRIMDELLAQHVKAVVIACNTATSAAKPRLMQTYPEIPIVGIEPALKEAIDDGSHNILVMGTELTVHLPKFQTMMAKYQSDHNIYAVPCPGLADYVEGGMTNPAALHELLTTFLAPYLDKPIDGIVLGCTHYPFVRDAISAMFKPGVPVHTGFEGVAKQLRHVLTDHDSLTAATTPGDVIWMSSQPGSLDYYQHLYDMLKG